MTALDRLQQALAGRYTIEREIGHGGMATVYLAGDVRHRRQVAVKVLRGDLAQILGPERFLREIELAARLHHPHILPLYDSGEADGFLYYVMPFAEGESLRQRLAREGELPIAESVRILRDVVDALAYAHGRGVVHRDIKPDNVMLAGRHALVTDFGVAKAVSEATGQHTLTSAGVALGTPAYMAPEQAVADPHVDHRADLYAVGALGYELLTGRPPFLGPSAQAVLAQHVTEPPEPVSAHRDAVTPPLAELIMRCLAKKPADRPQSADDLLTKLDAMTTPSGGLAPTDAVVVTRERERRRPFRRGAMVAGGIGVAAVTVAMLAVFQRDDAGTPGEERPTLVVLPFESIGDAADLHFADGISEEITGRLSRVSGLRVIARLSAQRYAASGLGAREFAAEVGAQYVLAGTVRWVPVGGDSRVRVSPALVRVQGAEQVWGETYDAVVTDVFALQSDIARKVADGLEVRLAAREQRHLADPGTSSVEAQRAYLLGRFHWRKRTADGLQQARRYFEEAVRHDSTYARAWSGLADALVLHPFYGVTTIPKREAYDRAEAAARRALRLDSTLAEGWTSLAEVRLIGHWDWAGAERRFQRAIALDPDYATGHHWHAEVFMATGRIDESIAAIRRAVELDPLAPIHHLALGYVLTYARRWEESATAFFRALEMEPSLPTPWRYLMTIYIVTGRPDSAVAALARIGDTTAALATVVRAMADPAWRPRGVAVVERGLTFSPHLGTAFRAFAHTRLSQIDRAFAALDSLLDVRDEDVVFLRNDPRFTDLHGDPRWDGVMRRMGL